MPPQWRHFSIAALAALVAMIGVEQSSFTGSSSSTTNQTSATDQTAVRQVRAYSGPIVQLPKVESISLPPIPVRNPRVKEPFVPVSYAVLIDEATQLPLYEKQADQQTAVASTTKIITALVALEKYPDLNQRVQVSSSAINQIGSSVGFRAGETATIRQLLHGLMIVSGNDAALVLAEQLTPVGGSDSTTAFVNEMNKLAQRLGMRNSRFQDPAGLDDQGYSTAGDMAKAMTEVLKKPELAKIMGLADYQYTSLEGYLHVFKSSNRLVTEEMFYQGIIGGKTGYTPKIAEGGAGHCLVAAAERQGHKLIAVVLDTHDHTPQASAEVAKQLFDFGFQNFTWQSIDR